MDNKPALTSRQQEIYDYTKDKILNRGYGPTVREIGKEFDINSPNGVMCHLKALEKKGYIIREENLSRAIQLVDDPVSLRMTMADNVGENRIDFSNLIDNTKNFCVSVANEDLEDQNIVKGDTVICSPDKEVTKADDVVYVRSNLKLNLIYGKNVKETDHVLGVVVGLIREL